MNSKPPMPPGSRIWPRLGAIIVACVLLYYGFVALNSMGLTNQTGVATVLDKAYYSPGTSYQTLNIGGRVFVRPHDTAEAYVLKLQLNEQETAAMVDKGMYDTLNPNAEVQVTYQRSRITGATRVVQVAATAQKGGR